MLKTAPSDQKITVCGWVRTFRNDRFLAVNDGSTINNLQLVIQKEDHDEDLLKKLNTGAAISAEGVLVESQGTGQTAELQVSSLELLGGADPDEFPIQMKRHSLPDLSKPLRTLDFDQNQAKLNMFYKFEVKNYMISKKR